MRKTLGLLLVGAVAAGCGSAGPSSSTGQTGASARNAGGPAQNPAGSAFAYSRCMRSHGVANFPDPHVVSSPGHQSIAIAVNPSITGSPKFGSAQKACNAILPAMMSGPTAAQQRAHAAGLLAFARCLRGHGIGEFPDPNSQGQLRLPAVIAAGVDIHSHQFLDAGTACAGVSGGVVSPADIRAAVSGTAPTGGTGTGGGSSGGQ